jgi:hypothetical protein
MAISERVQPGDLITADFFNRMLIELNQLDQRVAALEGQSSSSGQLVITGVFPEGPLRVGQEIQVTGRNFGVSIGAQRVFIKDVRVTDFKPQSTDSLLVFDIPSIAGLPDAGMTVTLSVTNQNTDTRSLFVLPAQLPLGGQVTVTFDSMAPLTPVAGSPVTFRYNVTSRANQSATFTILPTINVSSNQAQWQSALQVLDDTSGSPLSGNGLLLAPNQSRFVKVAITSVPSTPVNAQFSLTVAASAPGVTIIPDTRTFTVGQATPPQDTTIDVFDIINAVPPGALSGSTVQLSAGKSVTLGCRVHFTVQGTYDVTAALTSGSNWTADRDTSSTPTSYTINPSDIGTPAAFQNPDFIIRAASTGASANGAVELRIQREGQTALRTRPLSLQLV